MREGDADVIVGFSWGGGVLAEMIHRGIWKGPSLLLAPTSDAMASIAMSRLPSVSMESCERLVKVVHASHDGFCPASQRQHFIDCGADCKLLQDGHTFDRRESVREIARILQDLIDLCNS